MEETRIFLDRPGLERLLDIADFKDPLEVLADDRVYLGQALDRLAALADDQHLPRRAEVAAGLCDCFSRDLDWLAQDQEGVLALLEGKCGLDRTVRKIAAEIRKEQVMIRRLLPPVMHRLRQIEAVGLADDPAVFVIAALVFCEFVKMHIDYGDATLLPLGSIALAPGELEELAIDMILRRRLRP